MRRLDARLAQAVFVAACFALWAVAGARAWVSPIILPPLGTTLETFWTFLRDGTFWPDLLVTLGEFAAAFAIAAVGGVLGGAWIAQSAFSVRVFDPLLSALYAVPTILLFPLFVLFFGLGPGSKIAIGAAIAFFPVCLTTIAGLANIEPGLLRAARSMGASSLQIFARVRLPAAAPVVIGGLRFGAIVCFLSVIGSETIASLGGLGHQIVGFSDSMDTPAMFAYTLFVMAVAIALNALVGALERRALRRLG